MDKNQLDELYHNLRVLCVTEDLLQKEAVAGIVSHLTQPRGDYVGLLRFLSYYGEKYILPSVVTLLRSTKHLFELSRVVDLGAGFGWLGRGISNAFDQMPVLFVDKRQWVLIDIVADIETKNGMRRVLDELKKGDLIVMSELLHCLENPGGILQQLRGWPMLVVEYHPARFDYKLSYDAQIERFGCRPVPPIDVTPIRRLADPYGIWLVLPERTTLTP